MKHLVGTLGELWRYPVKSMLGEQVSELTIGVRGGMGDRAWALRVVTEALFVPRSSGASNVAY